MRAMKKILSLASTLIIGSTLALTACGKDKKAATTTEPPKTEPATEATKAEPATEAPKADDKPKEEKSGW